MTSPHDPIARLVVGRRVSLRHRLPDGRATDVVGRVAQIDGDTVVLVDRHDHTHEVELPTVLAVREVAVARGPDPRTAEAATLELVAADSWHDLVEPLGEWWLRYAGGATNRANSALAVGDPGGTCEDAVAAVVAFAARHGIPPQVQAVVGSPEDTAVRSLGWSPVRTPVAVLVTRLSDLLAAVGPDDASVALGETLEEPWFARYEADHPTPAAPDQVRRLLTSGRTVFASTYADDALVGIGRGSLARDWLTVFGLWTDPAVRRQGLMRSTLGALGRWAAARGARSVQLQVDTANVGALAAYERLGFVRHHRYRYLSPP